MQSWHTTYLGLRELPREISTFELQSFFTYSRTERELINARRSNAHKLGLAPVSYTHLAPIEHPAQLVPERDVYKRQVHTAGRS